MVALGADGSDYEAVAVLEYSVGVGASAVACGEDVAGVEALACGAAFEAVVA